MSVQTEQIETPWAVRRVPKPRIRGLALPALPSGALLAQLCGAVATEAGIYLAWGLAATLIAGGIAAAVLGALREAGKV